MHVHYTIMAFQKKGLSWSWSYVSWIYNYLCNRCLSPLTLWVRILRHSVLDISLCDKVCQWHIAGQWFSPCIPVSSTNKTDCHDITEILLINTITSFSIIQIQNSFKSVVDDCLLNNIIPLARHFWVDISPQQKRSHILI